MLRTSLRTKIRPNEAGQSIFLSSNAQDFIEDSNTHVIHKEKETYLSSNAQDFIEDTADTRKNAPQQIPEQ